MFHRYVLFKTDLLELVGTAFSPFCVKHLLSMHDVKAAWEPSSWLIGKFMVETAGAFTADVHGP